MILHRLVFLFDQQATRAMPYNPSLDGPPADRVSLYLMTSRAKPKITEAVNS